MEKQRWEEPDKRREEKRREEKRRREKIREEKRREEERRLEKRKGRKKEDAGAGQSRNVAIHCVFPMVCGSRGSKSRLAKAAGAESSGEMRGEKLHAGVVRSKFAIEKASKHLTFGTLLEIEMSKKCTPLWREARFEVQSVKN